MIRPALAMISMHIKCRGGLYPRSNVERFPVPDEKVGWSVEYKNYKPVNHSAPSLHGQPWADPEIGQKDFKPNWNSIDGDVSRVSYMGQYKIQNGYPLNPIGRTGIVGRGVLGRWGPNHAADPVVTQEKKDWERRFKKFFSGGEAVYKGYIDDHRNTDNAWMESVANSFHDETGDTVGALSLHAGDDAVGVQWADITPQLKLYGSHKQMVDEVYRRITNTK
ncbi:ADP-ribose pyrophosphatase, mitochondrial [Operophtera brumata]|uniref:ADP-ribose pyrophosphatase, mitochondrial n=1 Tax=Operophtera brumata TaxID=104452 RepID=A0A0L7KM66_OPEBR|nr:ADP-ribose pyrophosphatase, mitochondrial [Operophtera brumata]